MNRKWVVVVAITGAVALVVPLQDVWRAILWLLPDDEPNTASSIAGWLQGFATIIALYFTYRALTVTAQEAHASNETLKAQQLAAVEQARPRAIFDFHRGDNNAYYVVKNVGPGAALNVYAVDDPVDNKTRFTALGGLLQGEQGRVNDRLQAELERQVANPLDQAPLFVVAQPAIGDEWMLSVNRISGDRIAHEVLPWKPSARMVERLKAITIDEQLREQYSRFNQA